MGTLKLLLSPGESTWFGYRPKLREVHVKSPLGVPCAAARERKLSGGAASF